MRRLDSRALTPGGPAPPAGLTLLEVVVAIGVVAVLTALVLPAVLDSRASAASLECRMRMRDASLAWGLYCETYRVGPPGPANYHRWLAPFVEASAGDRVDATAVTLRTICPADSRTDATAGRFSLVINRGIHSLGGSGMVLAGGRIAGPDDFVDGLSQTAFWSERVVPYGSVSAESGDLPASREPGEDAKLYVWYLTRDYGFTGFRSDLPGGPPGDRSDWKAGTAECNAGGVTARPVHRRVGQKGAGSSPVRATFGTFAAPNRPTCAPLKSRNGLALVQKLSAFNQLIDPPTSRHRGGVNVSFADGSARQISESIDLVPWIQSGTIAGEERDLPGW